MGHVAPTKAKCMENFMRSKFKSVFAFATAAAVILGGINAAFAATVGLSSVGGIWTQLVPMPPGVKGLNTNSVSWGTPYNGTVAGDPNGKQSGYSFVGAAAGTIQTNTNFNLGTFTHNNFVINSGTSIMSARLSVSVNLMIGSVNKVVNTAFDFLHDETNNLSSVCKNGAANGSGDNVNGCADNVKILNNTASDQTVEIDGFNYILEITGFTVAGQFFNEFWTIENQANAAVLQARFTLVGPTGGGGGGEPPPAPVPLPAAGWLMLAGLGALSAARTRRKA